jgi:hypothetical protein
MQIALCEDAALSRCYGYLNGATLSGEIGVSVPRPARGPWKAEGERGDRALPAQDTGC